MHYLHKVFCTFFFTVLHFNALLIALLDCIYQIRYFSVFFCVFYLCVYIVSYFTMCIFEMFFFYFFFTFDSLVICNADAPNAKLQRHWRTNPLNQVGNVVLVASLPQNLPGVWWRKLVETLVYIVRAHCLEHDYTLLKMAAIKQAFCWINLNRCQRMKFERLLVKKVWSLTVWRS